MIKKLIVSVILAIGLVISTNAQSGLDIMKKYKEQSNTNDQEVEIVMKLINNKGQERTRTIHWVTKNNDKEERSSLLRFLTPADVKGTGFLSIEHIERDDDQWLFLPALNKSRRISASDETDNFMGSDLTFEDLKTEEIEEYKYEYKGTQKVDGIDCYVIIATPSTDKRKKETGYSKRELFVRTDNYLFAKVNYYNKEGELYKIFHGEDPKIIKGSNHERLHKISMENLKTGSKTIIFFNGYKIDHNTKWELYTKRNLEKI